jgi:hypothetical protein
VPGQAAAPNVEFEENGGADRVTIIWDRAVSLNEGSSAILRTKTDPGNANIEAWATTGGTAALITFDATRTRMTLEAEVSYPAGGFKVNVPSGFVVSDDGTPNDNILAGQFTGSAP